MIFWSKSPNEKNLNNSERDGYTDYRESVTHLVEFPFAMLYKGTLHAYILDFHHFFGVDT